jgi:hypothetical protein
MVLGLTGAALGLLGLSAATRLAEAHRELAGAGTALEESRGAVAAHRIDLADAALDRADARLSAAGTQSGALPLSILRPIPLIGSPVKALQAGTQAGREILMVGRITAEVAHSMPASGTAGVDGHDLSALHRSSDVSGEALDRAEVHLAQARRALRGPAGAVLPPISAPARDALRDIENVGRQLTAAARGLHLVGQLTAPTTEARFLVLSQDSMELRPTGGFVGSFGVLRVSRGTVALERYDNVLALPPPEPPMEAPEHLATSLDRPWDFSNANWWPDFPTSARTIADLFARQHGGQVDGVIALTEAAMARVVGALGSVQVPGYTEPVTEEGFAQRVLYEVELKRPLDTPVKRFLTLLAAEVFDRLFQLPADRVPDVVDALKRSAEGRDVQVWFAQPEWQAAVAGTMVDGALPPPDPAVDFLLLAEANLTGSKANAELIRDMHYSVRPLPDGRLEATLRIDYRNEGPETEINPYYNGLVRVYVPRGAELAGDEGDIEDAPDGPYRVLVTSVYVPPQGSEVLTLSYLLPPGISHDGHYRLTWRRQPGTPRDTLTATVAGREYTAPPGRDLVIDIH